MDEHGRIAVEISRLANQVRRLDEDAQRVKYEVTRKAIQHNVSGLHAELRAVLARPILTPEHRATYARSLAEDGIVL